jgi:PAS domain S-box-containing protein
MATILIVDDLVANRTSLAALLRPEGHELLEAADGRAGLEAVRAHHPDLVITDVLMPVVDGREFVRQLRIEPLTSTIPVLFYTAPYGEREARALARASGVPYVLTKPPQPVEVLKIVREVLAGTLEIAAAGDPTSADPEYDREQLRLLGGQLLETGTDLRSANARLRGLINIGLDFAWQRDSDRRLRRLCTAAHDLFAVTYVTLGILGRDDRRVRQVVTSGADASAWIAEGDALSGLYATVVDERRTVRGRLPSSGPSDRSFPSGHPEVQAFLIAPIASPAHVYGWLSLVGNEGHAFSDEEEQQVLALAGQVGRIYELEHEIVERQQAEAALRLSERLNHNLLEHLPHRIVIKDRHAVVRFCNSSYATHLGRTVADVVGKDAYALHSLEFAASSHADDLEVMGSGVLKNMEEHYEVDGQKRWVRSVKVPYRDERGEVTGVLVVFEDVTEQRLLEQELNQAQKMEAVGRLAGGVAHDFNNLLTAILGYCQLVLKDLLPDDRHRADIAEILRAGSRAAALTKQLLAFSRKEIIEPTTLDLNVVVTEMQMMLGRLIREDVRIMAGLRAAPALVVADRSQIDQLVLNLAVNARDAMPDGGTLTIETANVDLDEHYAQTHPFVKPGAYIALIVTDTGSGMTPEVQARVFEPFFTTKTRSRGTGLGLASVHGIVARSGGSVSLYSEVGHGTTFTVYFPQASGTTVGPPPLPVARTLAGTETVLVVEDADGLRSLIRRLLELQGYTVLVAANAGEAGRLFEENPSIDVLLTDVVMPGASGPELTRHLMQSRPGLKVIYMSGYTEDTIVERGVLRTGIAFLAKPFTADTLAQKVRTVLDGPP